MPIEKSDTYTYTTALKDTINATRILNATSLNLEGSGISPSGELNQLVYRPLLH